jgi:LmbE family N-acetylglucosaminyl deacetylase
MMRTIDPPVIFVNDHGDTHQDHRHVAMYIMTATRYTKSVLFDVGLTTQNSALTVFSREVKAFEAHTSQIKKPHIERINMADLVRSSAHFRGIQGRVRNAERVLPLHLFISMGM